MLGGLTVAAIIPATILVLVIAATVGLAGGEAFGSHTIETGVLMVCLQLGYFGGAAFRWSLGTRMEQAAKLFAARRPRSPNA
jgi:hypothetical protein